MFLNPRYKGYYTANLTYIDKTHKKVIVPESEQVIYKDHNIPAIVSEELWDKANFVYNGRRKIKNENIINKEKIIDCSKYTNKIICSCHNKFFSRKGSGKRENNLVWVCKEYKVGVVLRCNFQFIKEAFLNKTMISLIEEKLKKEKFKIKERIIKKI